MFTPNSKLSGNIGLLVMLLLGIFMGIGIKSIAIEVERTSTQRARRTIVVDIEKTQWNEFFGQLRKFAEKWRYAVLIDPLDSNGESFIVDMWRADIRVTVFMNNIYDPGVIQIFFYDTDRMSPVREAYFEEEVNDLIGYLDDVPNVTITEER